MLLLIGIKAEGQNLRSYTIGTYGASKGYDEGAVYISVGEAMNTEIEEDGNKISQGFLQVTILGKTVSTEDAPIDFELKVFPNPVNQYLNIQLSEMPVTPTTYQVIDLSGKLINSAPITGMSTQIDFKSLDTGIYFLQIKSQDKQSKVVKIQKQNL